MAAVLADQITCNNSPRRSDDVGALPLCTEHIDLVHIGISMVLAAGISPATSSFGETRSNKLSYASKIGVPRGLRSLDLQFEKLTCWPTTLWGQNGQGS